MNHKKTLLKYADNTPLNRVLQGNNKIIQS